MNHNNNHSHNQIVRRGSNYDSANGTRNTTTTTTAASTAAITNTIAGLNAKGDDTTVDGLKELASIYEQKQEINRSNQIVEDITKSIHNFK